MRIYKSSEIDEVKNRVNRKASVEQDVLRAVRDIIANVEKTGDKALFEYTARFDGFALSADNIRVTKQEIKQAYDTVSSD